MKIATSLNIRPPYLDELRVIPHVAAAGFDGADFNFCDLIETVDWRDEPVADAFVDALASAADECGLAWFQAHGPMFNMFGESERDIKARELTPHSIRACGRLGVPWMVLHPETLVGGAGESGHYAEQMRRNIAFFRDLLPLCERWNVGIAIENLTDPGRGGIRSFGGVVSDLIELIDALSHPLIGACWDTGHAKINKLDQRAGISALGSRLKALHVQENDGRGDDHMLPFANGPSGIDWKSVIAGLRAAGYAGAFTYEAHNGFRSLPEPLFDDALKLSAKIARYLADSITNRES